MPAWPGQIKQSPGAIGYVELAYAKQNNLPFADLKNAAGNYVSASIDSVVAALATATIPDDFRFSMVNSPGDAAYPIAGATWLLVYRSRRIPPKAKSWCNSSGGPSPTARRWRRRWTMPRSRPRCSRGRWTGSTESSTEQAAAASHHR